MKRAKHHQDAAIAAMNRVLGERGPEPITPVEARTIELGKRAENARAPPHCSWFYGQEALLDRTARLREAYLAKEDRRRDAWLCLAYTDITPFRLPDGCSRLSSTRVTLG